MFNVPCKLCNELITEESQQEVAKNSSIITVAQMLDNKRFTYGISGEYSFITEDLPLQKGDSVCAKCMKKHKFEPFKGLECSLCKEKYKVIFEKSGDFCSGHIRKEGEVFEISCGYGSRYDTSVFSAPVNVKEGDIICDFCIARMVETKEIELKSCYLEELFVEHQKLYGDRARFMVTLRYDDPMKLNEE